MVAPLTTQKPLFAATTRKAISYPLKPEPLEFDMKKIYILLILLGTIVSVTGCRNTIDGMGDDIGNAADAVEDATD